MFKFFYLFISLIFYTNFVNANLGNPIQDLDYQAFCLEWSNKLRTVEYEGCLGFNLLYSGHNSVEARPLLHREFLPPKNQRPKARVLAIGGVHGDEYSAISISYLWMKAMQAYPENLEHHWLFLPLANPDGLFKQPRATRENANGVDLNRNFPTPDWNEAAHKYWVKHARSNPRRFPGTEAASEPETQWQVSIIKAFQPDAIISIHAPYGLLDYDGPDFARPDKMGHLELRQLGTFPGSLGRYAGEYLDIPVLTIELESAGRLPNEQDMLQIWQDMNDWIESKLMPYERDF
ncbi:succinylglutamate desuccinylase/aspartoacylase family protein [Thiomicrospira microaerophila]|uniref:M14 family zinc carboxypeptidase n=1 Tax=Thiomicrospira microaerophila TaxID=406020 RepID=UPI00200D33FE|nr:M14 family zinc carboxypeptidase [Thiomicrospira microaerophila]UQB42728.1 succinylglutamate desuccinylase/aspartoacylase family protein [Thiomicrospira microaerophila]